MQSSPIQRDLLAILLMDPPKSSIIWAQFLYFAPKLCIQGTFNVIYSPLIHIQKEMGPLWGAFLLLFRLKRRGKYLAEALELANPPPK